MPSVVAIALAAYEPDLDFFREQLESILRQTEKDWICVITLDSALENVLSSAEIRNLLKDPRFSIQENPVRLGHKKNFEKAAEIALRLNPWAIAFCDQDDIWYPNKIEVLKKLLAAQPPRSLAHTDSDLLDQDTGKVRTLSAWETDHRGIRNVETTDLIIRNVASGCALIVHADLVRENLFIPEEFPYHDHWYTAVASRYGGVHSSPERLYAYRQHQKNVIGAQTATGLFRSDRVSGVREFARRSVFLHRSVSARAQVMQRNGWNPSPMIRWMFSSFPDFGMFYLLQAARVSCTGDLILARAYVIRALGKAFSTFGVNPGTPVQE